MSIWSRASRYPFGLLWKPKATRFSCFPNSPEKLAAARQCCAISLRAPTSAPPTRAKMARPYLNPFGTNRALSQNAKVLAHVSSALGMREVRDQRSEIKSQKSEVRSQKQRADLFARDSPNTFEICSKNGIGLCAFIPLRERE